MNIDSLVRMTNQIGTFFRHEGPEKAADSVNKHIKEFWDPRMRTAILAHLAAGGAGLDPIVVAAVQILQQDTDAKNNAGQTVISNRSDVPAA